MAIIYGKPRDIKAAVQWTGSNESEIEELLERLNIDGTVSSSSGNLTITWNSGSTYNAGSATSLPTGYWIIEEFPPSTNPISWTTNESFSNGFRQVYP